ncbi:hypothetical protein BDV12DRAFT_175169 [Aspergillus spectabilis]
MSTYHVGTNSRIPGSNSSWYAKNIYKICATYERRNTDYHLALVRVSRKRNQGLKHKGSDQDWCECVNYNGHPLHYLEPWIVCDDDECEVRRLIKEVSKYTPKRPMIIETNNGIPMRRNSMFLHWISKTPGASRNAYPRKPLACTSNQLW